MDFWHDAAAQKRWLRRFALLTGVLLLPVLVLAVFARPSADDFIYAARTHAVVQQYGLDLPRLLRAAWDTNVYYYENWQGLYVSGFTLAFQPAIFGNRYYGVTLVCVLLPLFLPVWAGTVRGVASGPGAKASALGTGAAVDLRLYRGHARPRGGIVLVQRCHELPAVLFAGRAERRAGVCSSAFADKLPTRRNFFMRQRAVCAVLSSAAGIRWPGC